MIHSTDVNRAKASKSEENLNKQQKTRRLLEEYKRAPSRRILNQLLEVNLGLVASIVRKTCPNPEFFDDVLQEAMINFCKAVESFELERNTQFSTYCAFYIRSAIFRWLNWNGQNIRVPRPVVTGVNQMMQAKESFVKEHGRQPTRSELSKVLGVSEAVLEIREHAMKVKNVLSFDAMSAVTLERVEAQTAYHIKSELEHSEVSEITESQRLVLGQLTPLEREVLYQRHYDGKLFKEIGASLGMAEKEVVKVAKQAIARCRAFAKSLRIDQDTGLSFMEEMSELHQRSRGRIKGVG